MFWFINQVIVPLSAAFRQQGCPEGVSIDEIHGIGDRLKVLGDVGKMHDAFIADGVAPADDGFMPLAPALDHVVADFLRLIEAWRAIAAKQAAAHDAHVRLAIAHRADGITRPHIAAGLYGPRKPVPE